MFPGQCFSFFDDADGLLYHDAHDHRLPAAIRLLLKRWHRRGRRTVPLAENLLDQQCTACYRSGLCLEQSTNIPSRPTFATFDLRACDVACSPGMKKITEL